jgi:hypothetical protein
MSDGEDPRPGRTSASTNNNHIEIVRAVIRGNRLLTVREAAGEVDFSKGSCHEIFTEKRQMHFALTTQWEVWRCPPPHWLFRSRETSLPLPTNERIFLGPPSRRPNNNNNNNKSQTL